jgi:hypothetical protein
MKEGTTKQAQTEQTQLMTTDDHQRPSTTTLTSFIDCDHYSSSIDYH